MATTPARPAGTTDCPAKCPWASVLSPQARTVPSPLRARLGWPPAAPAPPALSSDGRSGVGGVWGGAGGDLIRQTVFPPIVGTWTAARTAWGLSAEPRALVTSTE